MEIGPVEGALIQLASHLEALKLRWALIGGLAVSALAEPRTTGDVDVVISVAGDQEVWREAVSRNAGRSPSSHLQSYQLTEILAANPKLAVK